MYILGLNAFHGDSSACLIRDGVMIAAAEEERFRRIKHWAGFPSEAIRYCLAEAGIGLADLDHIAINQDAMFGEIYIERETEQMPVEATPLSGQEYAGPDMESE